MFLQSPAQFFNDGSMAQWAMLVMGVVAVIYLLLRKPRKRRDPLEHRANLSLSQQRAVETEMNNLLVELSQMAQQISAQLDSRAAKLEVLIAEADEKLRHLKEAVQAAPASAEKAAQMGLAQSVRSVGFDEVRERAIRTAVEAQSARSVTSDGARPIDNSLAATDARSSFEETSLDLAHREIYRLADEGKSSQQIAGVLGRPNGEIELILALRDK